MVAVRLYQGCQFLFKLAFLFFVSFFEAIGHVLPDEESQFVAPVIPTLRLYLDVFSYHVEAPFADILYLPPESFVGGGGVDSVGPVALVQRPHLEYGPVVEGEPLHAVFILQRYLSHSGVALYFVEHVSRTVLEPDEHLI